MSPKTVFRLQGLQAKTNDSLCPPAGAMTSGRVAAKLAGIFDVSFTGKIVNTTITLVQPANLDTPVKRKFS